MRKAKADIQYILFKSDGTCINIKPPKNNKISSKNIKISNQ